MQDGGREDLDRMVGLFINSVVLRTDLAGAPSFRQLLGRVRRTALDAYTHQDLPFETLVADLSPQRNASGNPLFDVMINQIDDDGPRLGSWAVNRAHRDSGLGVEVRSHALCRH